MAHGEFSTSGLQRRARHPRRGGDRHPRLRADPDQPGHRLHPDRHAGRPGGPRRADRASALAQLRHHHQSRGDRAVRRVRHHPAALLDRAGAVASAGSGAMRGWSSASARRELLGVGAADRRRHPHRRLWLDRRASRSASRWPCPRPRWCCRWSGRPARSAARPSPCCCSRIWRSCRSSSRSARWRRTPQAEGLERPARHALARRAGRRRDARARPLRAAAAVRAGGADQEPGAVPRRSACSS